jgi:hypothetical protein
MLSWSHMTFHVEEMNWVPLSVVTVAGMPKHATQPARKESSHMAASMFLHKWQDLQPSGGRVKKGSKYTCPSGEAGRGPTKSACTWLNLFLGM